MAVLHVAFRVACSISICDTSLRAICLLGQAALDVMLNGPGLHMRNVLMHFKCGIMLGDT